MSEPTDSQDSSLASRAPDGGFTQPSRQDTINFILIFLIGVFGAQLYLGSDAAAHPNSIAGWARVSMAHSARAVLDLFGYTVFAKDHYLQGYGVTLAVLDNCSGLLATVIFCSAVVGFPVAIKLRLLGFFLGTLVIQAVNIGRIVSLYLVQLNAPEYMHTLHTLVWPTTMIFLAVGLFIIWARWSMTRESSE